MNAERRSKTLQRVRREPAFEMTPSNSELEHISAELRLIGIQLFGLPSVPDSMRVDYRVYMQSDAWHVKRAVALARDKNRCVACNSGDRLEVHHRTYERLGDEYPEDIYTFCYKCHLKLHDPEAE